MLRNPVDFDYDLQAFEFPALLELKIKTLTEIADIDRQLDRAKAKKLLTGEYSDPDWWRRCVHTRRCKGLLVQQIQHEIQMRKEHKGEKNHVEHAQP